MDMNYLVRMIFLFLTILMGQCEPIARKYSDVKDALTISKYRHRFLPLIVNHAKIARQLVHQADWSSVGSLSTDHKINGFPMVNIISIADSAKGARSTGNIYFLLTDLDFTGKDWQKENKVSFLFSREQGGGCSKDNVDPMEPTCSRAIISGKVIKLEENSVEYPSALYAYVSRHPVADIWIRAHHFYLCKLNITNIYLLDWYGGPKSISVDDYYRSDPDAIL